MLPITRPCQSRRLVPAGHGARTHSTRWKATTVLAARHLTAHHVIGCTGTGPRPSHRHRRRRQPPPVLWHCTAKRYSMLPIMPRPVRTRDQTRGGPCRLHRGTMATKIRCSGRWAGSRSISCTPAGGYSFFFLWKKMATLLHQGKGGRNLRLHAPLFSSPSRTLEGYV